MGQRRVETFKILFPDKHEGFADLFLEELDSWFTADIACCDNCYDEFVSRWPGTYIRDLEFQRSGIPLDIFYEGSDLAEVFTLEEFNENLTQLNCPRCDAQLEHNIWPYCFPFDPPDGFEEIAIEVSEIARTTPFLLLKHEFAKSVHDEVQSIALLIEPENIQPHFRGRTGLTNPRPEQLGPPPNSKTSEGRYNHAGRPVCYLASDASTVFLELGTPEIGIHVAEIEVIRPVKILDLLDDRLNSNTITALIYSSLLSTGTNDDGWNRPEYVFTRFVADCAYAAGLDGIRYPTTRASTGSNLVLFGKTHSWDSVINIGTIGPHPPTANNST